VRSQIDKVVTIMKLCENMEEFRAKFARVFKRGGITGGQEAAVIGDEETLGRTQKEGFLKKLPTETATYSPIGYGL
jgi:hypothetical protein